MHPRQIPRFARDDKLAVIERPAAAALNHLLSGQAWARERLRPFAGKRVSFRLAPLPDLRLLILDSGLLDASIPQGDAPDDLTVTVKPGALPLLLARDEAALREVDLAGPADLASTVQALFRDLEWDAEEDLSKLLGDVLAHRVAGAARGMFAWQKDAALRLGQNIGEYLTEEQAMLAPGAEAAVLARGVQAAAEDCARLERRIDRLEALAKRQQP